MTSVISRKTFSSSKYYFSNRKLNIMDGWMDGYCKNRGKCESESPEQILQEAQKNVLDNFIIQLH